MLLPPPVPEDSQATNARKEVTQRLICPEPVSSGRFWVFPNKIRVRSWPEPSCFKFRWQSIDMVREPSVILRQFYVQVFSKWMLPVPYKQHVWWDTQIDMIRIHSGHVKLIVELFLGSPKYTVHVGVVFINEICLINRVCGGWSQIVHSVSFVNSGFSQLTVFLSCLSGGLFSQCITG